MSLLSSDIPSTFLRIEMLQAHNWLPWKRRVNAVACEKGLDGYFTGTNPRPVPKDPKAVTDEEKKTIATWEKEDRKAQGILILTISDSEMIHITGATSAKEMWDQLRTVKEARGVVGIMSARRQFYRIRAEEGADITSHIAELRKIQEELHLMGSAVTDTEFLTHLITSLPESWDQFTSGYFGASGTLQTGMTSHQLVALIIQEDRRRRDNGGSEAAMQFRTGGRPSSNFTKTGITCYNCKKEGHTKGECWSTGGGKEGKGPKGKKRH